MLGGAVRAALPQAASRGRGDAVGHARHRPFRRAAAACAARLAWTGAAFQEHRTGVACAATLRALIEARAPLDLIALASRFPLDEMVHVELCARMAMELGGGTEILHDPIDDDRSTRRPTLSPLMRAASCVVRFFCVGEALSIPLLRGTWHAARHPLPRAVLGRIVQGRGGARRPSASRSSTGPCPSSTRTSARCWAAADQAISRGPRAVGGHREPAAARAAARSMRWRSWRPTSTWRSRPARWTTRCCGHCARAASRSRMAPSRRCARAQATSTMRSGDG